MAKRGKHDKRVKINGYMAAAELEALREEWFEERHEFEEVVKESEEAFEGNRKYAEIGDEA